MRYNRIANVALETHDVGAIYAGRNWTSRGNIIRHNFIDSSPNAVGIYLDDAFSGAQVYGNVIRGVSEGVLIGGGRDNVVENNVILTSTRSIRADARCLGWAYQFCEPGGSLVEGLSSVPYKSEPWASRYPQLVGILDDDPATPKYNVIRHNLIVDSGRVEIDRAVHEYGTVEDNVHHIGGGVTFDEDETDLAIDVNLRRQLQSFDPIPLERIGNFRHEHFFKVQIVSPEPGVVVLHETPVRVVAMTEDPMSSVQIRLDGEAIYSGSEFPDELMTGGPELSEGSHQLEVVAESVKGYVSTANVRFSKVNAAFRSYPENRSRVQGPLDIDVETGFPADRLARVAVVLERLERGEAVERWTLYDGRTVPEPFAFDTLRVPDGGYQLSLHIQEKGGATSTAAFTFTIANWNALHDLIEPPLESVFFGRIDRKKTIAESDGWTHQVDSPELFFGDDGRIARAADTTEFLIWEVADLRRFEFTLYAISETIGDAVMVESSADQSAWRAVEYDVSALERNDVWSKVVIAGDVEPGSRFLRLTFAEGGAPADAIQLGNAVLFSPRGED